MTNSKLLWLRRVQDYLVKDPDTRMIENATLPDL